jgi:uncharacterized cysteine cluster protein YcgN (CxxCxxCC family)
VIEMKLFKRNGGAEWVEFCERCGAVCDAACRAEAVRDAYLQHALRYGLRVA